MAMLQYLFRWRKRPRFPVWLDEHIYGRFRVLLGMDADDSVGFHYVIRLQRRDVQSIYKDVGTFKSYEWPQIAQLLGQVDTNIKSLPNAG